jgi:hypothetical protein
MYALAWIIGTVCMVMGQYCHALFHFDWKLALFEAQEMQKSGRLPGEPEYMGPFRVTRAELDAMDARRNMLTSRIVSIIGLIIILGLILHGIITKLWM